jgi:hypothetical protein
MCILTNTYPARTAEQSKGILLQYRRLRRQRGLRGAAENLLGSHSLRATANALWKIRFSDPHKALAFDKLHVFAGLTNHFLEAIYKFIMNGPDGLDDITTIDDR